MVSVLIHSSKTMRSTLDSDTPNAHPHIPALLDDAEQLSAYLKSLSTEQVQQVMSLSPTMAEKTKKLIDEHTSSPAPSLPAIDTFLGDIYSGLQSHTFTLEDRDYANNHLFILSGLYGILRALDSTQPYRLEMGYKLPGNAHDDSQPNITSLYEFWADKIAQQLPKGQDIINLSAKEYTKAVFPYLKDIAGFQGIKIISPKFLTISPKTGKPTFVTVHAKVARGAFARWIIQNKIEDLAKLKEFSKIGYSYSPELSTPEEPAFIAENFKGIGLSVRLTKK